jgi:hypothetical protein
MKTGSLLRCLALALLASSLHAAWSPPSAPERARLERALKSWHSQYNPAESMVRRPFSSPGYHTKLAGGFVHPTRDSLNYALGLLDLGDVDERERALAILRRVIALQDSNPASRTYGIWSWYLEEPLDRMSPPDWNWADFNGATLLQVARDHRARLPEDLAASVDQAILHACAAIKKRNVGPGYTNIAVMGAYVTLIAGETLDRPEFRDYGLARLARLDAFTTENGTFEEYNSPAYTPIALLELSRLRAHVRDPRAREQADRLLVRAWTDIATHFHPPTRQWGGPHSRAYSSLLNASVLALIQRGTAGRVNFGVDQPDREELRLPVHCPPGLEPLFRSLPEPRTVVQTFIARSDTVGTTYLHPEYVLGSLNLGDLWNQRRSLILHYIDSGKPGYLALRFLKNDYDFSSAQLTTAQHEGRVVGVVNLVTDGGDTHISLDKVKQARIRARDLRLRFEVGGAPARQAVVTVKPGDAVANVKLGTLPVSVTIPYARFEGRDLQWSQGGDAERQWLDLVLHEGADREVDLAALNDAVVGFVLAVGDPAPASATVRDGVLTVASGDLTASGAVKPGRRLFFNVHAPREDPAPETQNKR